MIIMQYKVFVSFSVTETITNFLFVGKTNKIHKCIVSVFYFIMFNTLNSSFQCPTEADMGLFQLLVLLSIQIIAGKVHI